MMGNSLRLAGVAQQEHNQRDHAAYKGDAAAGDYADDDVLRGREIHMDCL
jgi:hypothetical protein